MDIVRANPMAFLVALALFLPGIGLALGSLLAKRRPSATTSSLFAAIVGGGGLAWAVFLFLSAKRRVASVLAAFGGELSPDDVRRIGEAGHDEAMRTLWFGLALSVPVLVLAAIGSVRARRKPA